MLDHLLLGLSGGRLRVVADMSAYGRGPSNDMLVLSGGRAYVGNFGYDKNHGEAMRTTCLVKVETDSSVAAVADELLFPNGMVANEGGRRLIVAETFAARLTSFRILEDGRLSDRKVFASLPGHHPDGICLDCAVGVWVADAFGNRVSRVLHGHVVRLGFERQARRAAAHLALRVFRARVRSKHHELRGQGPGGERR